MKVSVSGQLFSFPRECICCGRNPDQTIYVSASKTRGKKLGTRIANSRSRSWGFPCCDACLYHEKAINIALLIAYGSVAIGLSFMIYAYAHYNQQFWACIALAVSGILFIVYGFTAGTDKIRAARARKSATCCADSPSVLVKYIGWHGSTHTFYIHSQSYAFAFMRANRNKLVNVPIKILKELER